MEKKMACPVCESTENIETAEVKSFVKLPFADDFPYMAIKNHCNDCDTDGDFYSQNDERYALAEKLAIRIEGSNILNHLKKSGKERPLLERALRLPQGTIKKWESTEFSLSGIALLRMVRNHGLFEMHKSET